MPVLPCFDFATSDDVYLWQLDSNNNSLRVASSGSASDGAGQVMANNRGSAGTKSLAEYRYFFIPFQQLDRTSADCAIAEACLAFVICAASIVANFACIANFFRRGCLFPELMFLITALGVCNGLLALLGIVKGVSRLADNWLLGDFGCVGTAAGWMATSIVVGIVMSLITNEQRRILLRSFSQYSSTTPSSPPNTAKRQNSSKASSTNTAVRTPSNKPPTNRLYKIVAFVFATSSVVFAATIYLFMDLQVAHVVPVERNKSTSIDVCIVYYGDRSSGVWLPLAIEIVFFLMAFFFPISIMTINYLIILRNVQLAPMKDSYRGRAKQRGRRRRFYVIFTMAATLVLFLVCTLPLHVASGYVLAGRLFGEPRVIPSLLFFLCTCLVNVRATVNPILQIVVCESSSSSPTSSSPSSSTTPRTSSSSYKNLNKNNKRTPADGLAMNCRSESNVNRGHADPKVKLAVLLVTVDDLSLLNRLDSENCCSENENSNYSATGQLSPQTAHFHNF